MVAYDYDRQEWVEGESARLLRLDQLRQDLRLLMGPDGREFAAFSGMGLVAAINACVDEIKAVGGA